MRNIGINETYINIIEDIYNEAKAKVHIEKQESEEINILRGVRQGDSISSKLFTAAIQEVFKNSDLELRGLAIDRERLTNLRFVVDVALTTNNVDDSLAPNGINSRLCSDTISVRFGSVKSRTFSDQKARQAKMY